MIKIILNTILSIILVIAFIILECCLFNFCEHLHYETLFLLNIFLYGFLFLFFCLIDLDKTVEGKK